MRTASVGGAFVAGQSLASQSVAEEFAGELGEELRLVLFEVVAQAGEAGEFAAVGHFAGVVDLAAGLIRGAEAADGIKTLQREAERVDALMADGAGGVGAMLHEGLAQAGGLAGLFELRHVRRRRW